MNSKITFCTGVATVTGANFLFESSAGTRFLVDCGMVQGEKIASEENRADFLYDPSSVDTLIITHAHLDHVGRIPKLVRDGFKGTIYSTPESRDLAELVLNDAVGILSMQAKFEGKDPLYSMQDVQAVFPLWKTMPYHQAFKISNDVSIYFKDAGHILGSAMVEVTVDLEKNENVVSKPKGRGDSMKILFTGDVGNSPAPLLRDTESIGDVDYMIMESVYGDRNHEAREDRTAILEKIIKDTIARGGTLVIPAFSIDRTQVLLYELNNMVEQKRIPSVPVFVDSPMAIRSTEVYKRSNALFNDHIQQQIRSGDNIFAFPHLEYTLTSEEAAVIDHTKGPKIILAGSGMSVGGRIIDHEAHYLSDPKSTILLVGYQTAGSLGRQIADGSKNVRIHGQDIKVSAHIETIYGYSAHKDSDHLVEFVTTATDRLKKVFVVMGEPKAAMHLAQRLNDEISVKALVPERGKQYELED